MERNFMCGCVITDLVPSAAVPLEGCCSDAGGSKPIAPKATAATSAQRYLPPCVFIQGYADIERKAAAAGLLTGPVDEGTGILERSLIGASPAAISSAAAAAISSSTTTIFGAGASLVHVQGSSFELFAIEAFDRRLSFSFRGHLHESEPL